MYYLEAALSYLCLIESELSNFYVLMCCFGVYMCKIPHNALLTSLLMMTNNKLTRIGIQPETVHLHANKACSNMIGRYPLDY